MVLHFRLSTTDANVNPTEISVGHSTVKVGRDAARVDVVVSSTSDPASISRQHAELLENDLGDGMRGVWVTDTSANGVLLNFSSVVARVGSKNTRERVKRFLVRVGDKLTFGTNATELTYELRTDSAASELNPTVSTNILWATGSRRSLESEVRDLHEVKQTESILLSQEDDRAVSESTEFPSKEPRVPPPSTAMLKYLSECYNEKTGKFQHTLTPTRFAAKFIQLADEFCTVRQALVANASERANPWFVSINAPAYVFGDLHGSYRDLKHFIDRTTPFGDVRFAATPLVFLGDYVDRGEHSVEVVACLLALKLHAPSIVHLLRGNHEDPAINSDRSCAGHGCFLQVSEQLLGEPLGRKVWEAANRTFSLLPVCGEIGRSIFVAHGGMPRGDLSLLRSRPQDIPVMPSLVGDSAGETQPELLVRDMLWSDPCHDDALGDEMFRPNERCDDGSIVSFTNLALDDFFSTTGYSLLIRAHQFQQNGVRVSKRGRVITVFSSSGYNEKSRAGIAVVLPDYTVKLMTFSPTHSEARVSVIESSNHEDGGEESSRSPAQPVLSTRARKSLLQPPSCSLDTSLTMFPPRAHIA